MRACPHLRQNWLTLSAMSGIALPATLRARACRFEVNWLNSSIWAGRTWNYTTFFAADPELRHTLLVFDGGAPTHPCTHTHNPPTHPQACTQCAPSSMSLPLPLLRYAMAWHDALPLPPAAAAPSPPTQRRVSHAAHHLGSVESSLRQH